MRTLATIAAALVFGSTVAAQELDPRVIQIDALAFETGGACYLAQFNAQNGTNFQAEALFRNLVALPEGDAMRRVLAYDILLSAADLAIGQTCDAAAPEIADSRLSDIFNSGMSACGLREIYTPEQAAALSNILDATDDAALQTARIDRGALGNQLRGIIRASCNDAAAPPTPDTAPESKPAPVQPEPPAPQWVNWRGLPAGAPITRSRNFDIPLADLLIEDRFIVFYDPAALDGAAPTAATLAGALELAESAVLETMPSLQAAVLSIPASALERVIDSPVITGVTQDRYGFFNQARPANNAAQDLVDQITTGLDDTFTPLTEVRQVRVYVVDGGIRSDHVEVADKLQHWRAIGDHHGGLLRHVCERHGTAVASLIAGAQLGIAGNVDLIDVDITPCDGRDPTAFPASHILIALDWISQTQAFLPGRGMPTIVNLSLGVPAGDPDAFVREGSGFFDPGLFGLAAFEDQIRRFLGRHPNITIVAAAGNEAANACHYFPASMPEVVTVGGTTLSDTLWGNSNFGPCVDTFALAEQVAVADADLGADGMSLVNGTSFSTAIVSGVIAHRLAAGQSIETIRRDILRPVTLDRVRQSDLARGALPENGALQGALQFLAKIPTPFRPDCEVNSYDGALNMRTGPDLGNRVMRTLQNGDGLLLLGTSGEKWLFVRLQDGQEGWVARSDRRATLVRNVGASTACTQ